MNTSCSNPAKEWCSACHNAPAYEHDPPKIYYCSRSCQSAHRPKHKLYCKIRIQRKKVLRVVSLLEVSISAYRESVSEFDLRDVARFTADPYDIPMSSLCTLAQKLLLGKNNIRQADSCRLLNILGLITSISTVYLTIGDTSISNTPGRRHKVMMANLKSGENWVIDLLDCQIGQVDVLTPLVTYFSKNDCYDIESYVFDSSYTASEWADDSSTDSKSTDISKDEDSMPTVETENEVDFLPETSAHAQFAGFVKLGIEGENDFRNKLLTGSAKSSQKIVDTFKRDVKEHMTSFLATDFGTWG